MNEKHERGLVPLSADPVTKGHLDIIKRACLQCHEVVVLITNNDQKKGKYLFTLSERQTMAEKAINQLGLINTRVVSYDGLLVDIYLRESCDVIYRGVRDENDKNFEQMMMWIHGQILPGLEEKIIYLQASESQKHVSSSMVKTFVEYNLEVAKYVPLFVQKLLQERIVKQFKLGVTGEIASGKSFVCECLANILNFDYQIPTEVINIDKLVKKVYDEESIAGRKLRWELAQQFGEDVIKSDCVTVNTKVLGSKLFSESCDQATRQYFIEKTIPHVERYYRQELAGKKGIILIEWALMAEMNMGSWCNGNNIVITSTDQREFVKKRNLSIEKLEEIKKHQFNFEEKINKLEEFNKIQGCGQIIVYENNINSNIDKLVRKVIDLFPSVCNALS